MISRNIRSTSNLIISLLSADNSFFTGFDLSMERQLMPRTKYLAHTFVAFLFVATNRPAPAQTPVAAGDIIVLRVVDRTSGNTQTATLQEYNPTSFNPVPVQSFSAASTGGNELTVLGNSTAGSILSLNPNNTVTFAGYRLDAGSGGAAASITPRAIGSLDLSTGGLNTNISLGTAYSGLTIRSAAAFGDGQTFYTSGANGTNGGPQLAQLATPGLPSTVTTATTSSLTTTTANNTRQIQVIGGNLYLSSGSGTPGQTVFQVGTNGGLPTTGNQTLVATYPAQGTANQYNSFAFARLGNGATFGAGYDTIYAVSNTNASTSSVQKFSYDGTAFTANGSITVAGANDIALRQNNGSVNLFVTTSTTTAATPSTILGLTDAGTGTLSGTFATLLTGTGNEGFYGIVVTPVPEPSTILAVSALGLGAVGAIRRRRKAKLAAV